MTALDLFPTLGELTGADSRSIALDGENILPILFGRAGERSARPLFWEAPQARALRMGTWKFVREGGVDYLFNLETDPGETTDLAKAEPGRLAELRAKHDEMRPRVASWRKK